MMSLVPLFMALLPCRPCCLPLLSGRYPTSIASLRDAQTITSALTGALVCAAHKSGANWRRQWAGMQIPFLLDQAGRLRRAAFLRRDRDHVLGHRAPAAVANGNRHARRIDGAGNRGGILRGCKPGGG